MNAVTSVIARELLDFSPRRSTVIAEDFSSSRGSNRRFTTVEEGCLRIERDEPAVRSINLGRSLLRIFVSHQLDHFRPISAAHFCCSCIRTCFRRGRQDARRCSLLPDESVPFRLINRGVCINVSSVKFVKRKRSPA